MFVVVTDQQPKFKETAHKSNFSTLDGKQDKHLLKEY
jgi:hypothetical protein